MKDKIKSVLRNRWFKFSVATIIYLLIFVVWTGNLWLLLGVAVIYDIYISKIMYRLFWRKHKELKKSKKSYRRTMEWVEAILFATIVATLIRIFFFEMYVIPTSSMEKTLLVGDYLCVSKVAYGPKMPNTPISFPFVHHTMPFSSTKKSFCEGVKWDYHRLKGFGSVKRGDAVVFNFPAGDTVLLQRQDATYYDVLNSYIREYGETEGRRRLNSDFTVISRPVDKRENYIKRAVGLPGDSLQVVDTQLYINGEPYPAGIEKMQLNYYVQTNGTPINKIAFEDMGIAPDDIKFSSFNQTYELPLTKANFERIRSMPNVLDVERVDGYGSSFVIFPNSEGFGWGEDNFGPLWIPSKGATVELTTENLPLYRRIIKNYEGNELDVKDDVIYINGSPADSYTFQMDYYFMMGDNRHNSADSRYWGFVPEDHVVGKASFVWLSLDKDKGWFNGKIRWRQMFGKIK